MTNNPPHILHVIPSLAQIHGGTTASVLEMITGMEQQGMRCSIALSDDDGKGRRLPINAPERALAHRHYFPKRFDHYTYTPQMAPWLDAHLADYDLVHIHGLFSHVNAMAGRKCRHHGIPYVITLHGMANHYGMNHKRFQKWVSFHLLERRLLEQAEAIHLTSRREEQDFLDLKINTPRQMIPLAVAPIEESKADEMPAAHPILALDRAETGPIILFMGRLHPIKNIEALLTALTEPGLEQHQLLIAGTGDAGYTQELKTLAQNLGLEARVHWLGFVTGAAKSTLFARADVFIQPSFSESFGMAAIEALSSGLPCVLTHGVANADDLNPAGLAALVDVTAPEIASGLLKATGRKTPDFIRKAKAHIEAHYSRSALAKAMAGFYDQAMRHSTSSMARPS
jgi:glycosyltransferase involved in cell wall biosynthesis